jgi:hypothetical protein
MGMSTHRCLLVVLLTLPSRAVAASNQAIPIVLGDSTVALNGPWKFHTGDDSRWTDPAFDDSGWESVDLTPSPGATDGDVGLSGYVPGWFKEDWPAWLPKAVAALTLILVLAQLLGRPWLFGAVLPHSAAVAVRYLITCVRLAFLLVLILIVHQGIRHQGREACYALPAVLAIGAVLFTSELVAVHVRGIWFPWGVGVSLSEYASVVFDALLFTLLVRRLWDHARHAPATAALESRA